MYGIAGYKYVPGQPKLGGKLKADTRPKLKVVTGVVGQRPVRNRESKQRKADKDET